MDKYKIETVQELKDLTGGGRHKFEVVSLFAGGGGSSIGYRMAGGKVLAVNEFIPEAVATYSANWPDTKVINGDIRGITAQDVLNEIGKQPGELDVLDGSPPCSAFSAAGAREKNWGKTKKYSDASQANVEDLFFDYIRILDGVKPKVFIAENVAGIGKGAAKGYLNEIIREMRRCGYTVVCKVLNAKWLGVPQSRPRAIFIGVRNDIWRKEYEGKTHPTPSDKIVTLAEAFAGLAVTDRDLKETNIEKYATYLELKKLGPGGQSKKYFQLCKANKDDVSGCITATAGALSAAAVRHWDNRAFSVSEVKRIMSVPDDYILTGDYSQRVERLGRMVAPLMYKAVMLNLLSLGVFNENT